MLIFKFLKCFEVFAIFRRPFLESTVWIEPDLCKHGSRNHGSNTRQLIVTYNLWNISEDNIF